MAHTHDHGKVHYGRIFLAAILINVVFVVVELVYGYWAGSLSLVADAGHNLSDVFGLVLGWGASLLAQKIPSPRRTYGLRRSSILAALANSILLLVAVGGIGWEAISRVQANTPVSGQTVIGVAFAGIIVNAVSAVLFISGGKKDLNIRSAFAHLAADAAVSLGVVVGGVAILFTGWNWLDPAISLLVVVVILFSTWDLLRDSVNLALDAVPEGIDPLAVENYLKSVPGVHAVHDLHIWGMSTTEVALTVHLVIPKVMMQDGLLNTVSEELHSKFGIEHTTIQIEHALAEEECRQSPAEVV